MAGGAVQDSGQALPGRPRTGLGAVHGTAACSQAAPAQPLRPGSFTACSRRRKCRRSPGRGHTGLPGPAEPPCLRCRPGQPTLGGRAEGFC